MLIPRAFFSVYLSLPPIPNAPGEEEQLAERVEEMDRFYAFMQRELEQMVARWKAMQSEK